MTYYDTGNWFDPDWIDFTEYYDANDLYEQWLSDQPELRKSKRVILSDGSVWRVELWREPDGTLTCKRKQQYDSCRVHPDWIPF